VVPSKSNTKQSIPNKDTQLLSADELIRLLVCHSFEHNGSAAHDGCEAEEIVLDIDVDGMRYLLVRLPKSDHAYATLSPREQEIARMVAKGYHNKTIAGVLGISSWTVCTHLRRIFAKFGVNSRAAMVARLHEIPIGREQVAHPRKDSPNMEIRRGSRTLSRNPLEKDAEQKNPRIKAAA
jgi:DNA-binding CsgD family transcriptional regulator